MLLLLLLNASSHSCFRFFVKKLFRVAETHSFSNAGLFKQFQYCSKAYKEGKPAAVGILGVCPFNVPVMLCGGKHRVSADANAGI